MPRTVHVYPKAVLDGSTWTLTVDVGETRFVHSAVAGVTVTTELRLLKIVFELVVDDTDTDQDIDDALVLDDIRPGPQSETVVGNWQATAEGIIAGLPEGFTEADFRAAWTEGDTQAMRNDANRALVAGPGGIGRGWTITTMHQHEGDDTVTESGI